VETPKSYRARLDYPSFRSTSPLRRRRFSKAREIVPEEVVDAIRPIYERGKKAMADHVRCYVHAAYSWGMKSEHDYRSSPSRRRKLS
jgi:hypothetical protein